MKNLEIKFDSALSNFLGYHDFQDYLLILGDIEAVFRKWVKHRYIYSIIKICITYLYMIYIINNALIISNNYSIVYSKKISKEARATEIALTLSVVNAANIGGLSTLTGISPNLILKHFIDEFDFYNNNTKWPHKYLLKVYLYVENNI